MIHRSNIFIVNIILGILLGFLFAGSSSLAKELTPYEIMKQVDDRYTGDTSIRESTMVLINRRGQQRVRHIKSFSKEFGKDSKSITFFLDPADVRNTAFLSFDWDDEMKEDDSWMYLPALRKVKRIAGGDKSGSFMGSDFTYADVQGVNINWYNYKFLKKSEMVDGHDTWVIESKPKKEFKKKVIKETGYLKSNVWIRKDIMMTIKGKFWVKKGKKIKFLTMANIEKIDGIWTAMKLQMITTKKGRRQHASVLTVDNLVYNKGVKDDMFTTQRMERGL